MKSREGFRNFQLILQPLRGNSRALFFIKDKLEDEEMSEQTTSRDLKFKVVCISCGVKIRENASDDSYGMCLRCFYAMLATRLRNQKRVASGEFVSER